VADARRDRRKPLVIDLVETRGLAWRERAE
jgi:hypothetical protein